VVELRDEGGNRVRQADVQVVAYLPEGGDSARVLNGVVVTEEVEKGSSLTRIIRGADGTRQEETIRGDGQRTLVQRFANGQSYEQRFSAWGELVYEHIQIDGTRSQTTTWEWTGSYGSVLSLTRLTKDGNKRLRE
jgi:hypothetical protein